MTSLQRMLGLVDLFTEQEPVWKVEELVERSGLSRATVYRYVRDLCDAGLLARVTASDYVLGPRIIELDRQIRLSDPLYTAGRPVVTALVAETGEIGILASLYGDRMICVYVENAPTASLRLRMQRGQVLPLFRGSTAKIILAHLPYRRLNDLYRRNAKEIGQAGLGADWPAFRNTLRAIRAAGHYVSMGELNPAVRAIAVPLRNADGEILGSLTLAAPPDHFTGARQSELTKAALAAARRVDEAVALMTGAPSPASPRRAANRRSA